MTDLSPATVIAQLRERLAKRKEPPIAECSTCHHKQPWQRWGMPCPSGLAIPRCEACGGNVSFTVALDYSIPSQDEDIETLLDLLSSLQARVEALETALSLFAPGSHDGQWGRIKAFIVNGAPTRDEGIQLARQITEWQCAIDDAVSGSSLGDARRAVITTTDEEHGDKDSR